MNRFDSVLNLVRADDVVAHSFNRIAFWDIIAVRNRVSQWLFVCIRLIEHVPQIAEPRLLNLIESLYERMQVASVGRE